MLIVYTTHVQSHDTTRLNAPPRKAEFGYGRHAMQVANECSYKLGQKMNLNFVGWFLHAWTVTYIKVII